jgi:hypothetical protein
MKKLVLISFVITFIVFIFFSTIVADSTSDIIEFYLPIFGGLLLIFMIAYVFIVKTSTNDENNNPIPIQSDDSKIHNKLSYEEKIIVPDTCPHCKNPNVKKIRLCEWCGNQIV